MLVFAVANGIAIKRCSYILLLAVTVYETIVMAAAYDSPGGQQKGDKTAGRSDLYVNKTCS